MDTTNETPPFPPLSEGLMVVLRKRFRRTHYDFLTDPRLIDFESGQQSVIETLEREFRRQTGEDGE